MSFKFTSTLLPQLLKSLHAIPPSAIPARLFSSAKVIPAQTTSLLASHHAALRLAFKQPLQKHLPNQAPRRSVSQLISSNSTRQEPINWTKIGSSAAVATIAVVGLNYALNRETRGALTASESS